jgi:predicted nucleotidyltransferase component of viral defense system
MRDIKEELTRLAHATQRPAAELSRQYVMEGVLRRLSASEQSKSFVLRGSLLTRIWAGPNKRVAEDLDFVGLYPFDLRETLSRLRSVLQSGAGINDAIQFDEETLTGEATWQETASPGVRLTGRAVLLSVEYVYQVDCGFGDPIAPTAVWLDYPSLVPGVDAARVLSCRAETIIGWKLHGLVDYGARRWRPKDLYDLILLTDYKPLDEEDLVASIRTAFLSRGTPLDAAQKMLDSTGWLKSDRSLRRWHEFQERAPACLFVDLEQAWARLGEMLRPLIERSLRAT